MHLTHRPRRLRAESFSRNLVREHHLSRDDLIYPVFVCEGQNVQQSIASMPGIYRWSPDKLIEHLRPLVADGLMAIAIFPAIDSSRKDLQGSEACNPQGLVPRTIDMVRNTFGELGVIADVALDPYTSHGLDGITNANGYVVNDASVEILAKQALVLASAGAHMVAPSDMMDGRVGAIRQVLEQNQLVNTQILAYTAKYASSFYGPFREAVDSAQSLQGASKHTFQLDPANAREAIYEAKLDEAEGADILMVKPAMPYLDMVTRIRQASHLPVFAYQVSGEYAMLMQALNNGWLDAEVIYESLISIKRAGADAILSYFSAMMIARLDR